MNMFPFGEFEKMQNYAPTLTEWILIFLQPPMNNKRVMFFSYLGLSMPAFSLDAISCENIEFILKRKIINRNLTNLLYRFVDKGGFPLIELQTVKESLYI